MEPAERKRRILRIACVTAGLAIVGAVLFFLARMGAAVPCVFCLLTGLSCPGCGNTRAVLMLAKGDILSALKYNYLFPLEFAYLAWVYFVAARTYYKTGKAVYKPALPAVDIILLVIILAWGIIRNILGI